MVFFSIFNTKLTSLIRLKSSFLARNRVLQPLAIFMLGLCAFSLGFQHEFVQFNARFALFAQEMLRNGPSFFPTVYQHYYPDYPATQTLLIYALSRLYGHLSWSIAVLPNAVAGAATLTLIYLIALKHSRSWALAAVLMALCSWQFIAAARSLALDQFTALAATFTFYLVYSVPGQQQNKRLYWLPLALLLGFLFRGPIGLIIPASIACGYFLLERDIKRFILIAVLSTGLLLLGMLLLLLAAYQSGGYTFTKQVLFMQIFGRLHELGHYPFYYYFNQALLDYLPSFPLALVVIMLLSKQLYAFKDNVDYKLLRHTAFWLLIVFVGLSIPSEKKLRYLLPLLPAAALISGYLFHTRLTNHFLIKIQQVIIKVCYALPWLGLLLILAAQIASQLKSIELDAYWRTASLCLFLLGGSMLVCRKHSQTRAISILALAALAWLSFNLLVIEPLIEQSNQVQPFSQQLQAIYTSSQTLVFYQIGPDAEDIKLMVTLNKPLPLDFLATPQALLAYTKPALFIAKLNNFQVLNNRWAKKFKIEFIGKIGHQPCVVFTRKLRL